MTDWNQSQTTDSYDAARRLTAATIGGQSESASYTGDGLRVSRTIASTTTSFVWDVQQQLPVVLDDGTQYVYGQRGLLSHLSGSSTVYYLPDALGTANTVVDSSGTVVLSQTYDEYGNLVSRTGSAYEEDGFAGQQTDTTGLQYLRTRYYDPGTGRLLGRDPKPENQLDPAVHQPYGYAGNNPSTFVDPRGKLPCAPGLEGSPDGTQCIPAGSAGPPTPCSQAGTCHSNVTWVQCSPSCVVTINDSNGQVVLGCPVTPCVATVTCPNGGNCTIDAGGLGTSYHILQACMIACTVNVFVVVSPCNPVQQAVKGGIIGTLGGAEGGSVIPGLGPAAGAGAGALGGAVVGVVGGILQCTWS